MGSGRHLLVMAPGFLSLLVLTMRPRRALTRKSQVSLDGWSSRCIRSLYGFFLILSTYTVVCLSYGLFYPCLDCAVVWLFYVSRNRGN